MIYFIGSMRCYDNYCHLHGITRERMGRDILFVMADPPKVLKGRPWQEGDKVEKCFHCMVNADDHQLELFEAAEDLLSYKKVMGSGGKFQTHSIESGGI